MEEIIVKIVEAIVNATGAPIQIVTAILAVGWAVSEVLGKTKKFEANGVVQAISSIFKKLFNIFKPKP